MFSQKMNYEYNTHSVWVSDVIDFQALGHHAFMWLCFICIADVPIDLAS